MPAACVRRALWGRRSDAESVRRVFRAGVLQYERSPQGSFQTTRELLEGLEAFSVWAKHMSFRVESPALKIGGVYDSYSFATDETGKVLTVSPIVSR